MQTNVINVATSGLPGTITVFMWLLLMNVLSAQPPEPDASEDIGATNGASVDDSLWSFQPLVTTQLPEVRDPHWCETRIDHFVLAKLEEQGIEPVVTADRAALIRRTYYALVGLPPTAVELRKFIDDPAPLRSSMVGLVDRLLASEHFGERWGRHWLDVVRFAESSGGGRSAIFPNAWRYRDYVIDAFNRDVPYDEFVTQQIAGDLMIATDLQQRTRHIVATAFLLLGPTNYELQDKEVLEMDIVDEQLDTLGKALLGMTIGCARCHDHKFDPIPTRDYYALAGILKSTKAVVHDNVSTWPNTSLPLPPKEESQLVKHEARLAGLTRERESLQAAIHEIQQQRQSHELDREPSEERQQLLATLRQRVHALNQKIERKRTTGPIRELAMATVDHEEVKDIPVAVRGSVHESGPIVPRGFLSACPSPDPPNIPPSQSGRLQLAEWIVSPTHPLTARVMVNRIWYWVFGEGIVTTVDNFGTTGARPSHPELLDYLAERFIEKGWSVKQLVREMMLSRTYWLSTSHQAAAAEVDPLNRLLWRMHRNRLDAECIRDSLLAIAGNLDTSMGGPGIAPGTTSEYGYKFSSLRRSVYMPVFRNSLPTVFESFDFADPNIQCGQRTNSIVAPQALFLMNHPFVRLQSAAAAGSLLANTELEFDDRVRLTFQHVLSREPTETEFELASSFVQQDSQNVDRWTMLYQTLFQSMDFRYVP